MDFRTVTTELLKRFGERRIRYGLIGGFALGLWGGTRSTVDLDFIVHRDDLLGLDDIMTKLGYTCRFRSENVSQYVSAEKVFGEVDFLHAFRQASLEMLGRAAEKEIFNGELRIRVLIPEDLIGLKLQAIKNSPARKEQDMADIKALTAARSGSLDWELVRRYAEILEAEDLLKEFSRE